MKHPIRFLLVVFLHLVLSATFFIPWGTLAKMIAPFTDVPDGHPFSSTINDLKVKGLVKGYGDGTFAPESSVTRAEFITMVIAATMPSPKATGCFSDVKGHWSEKFVCEAKKQGLVSGYANGKFQPNNNVNFAEAAVILAKANKLSPRVAAKTEAWYKPATEKLIAEAAVVTSVDAMAQPITRAEAGEMIWRLKTKTKNKPTKTYAALTAEIPTLGSCEELKDKLAIAQYRQSRGRGYGLMEMKMMAPLGAVPSAAPMAESESMADSAADYSTTNVQVEGVDEADIIKNDGEFLYMVSGKTIRIVRLAPPEDMAQVTKVEMPANDNFQPTDLFLTPDRLVVLGSTYVSDSKVHYGGSRTAVYIYSMNDERDVSLERKLEFDGNQVSSRRIGDRLYLVTNDYPSYMPMYEKDIPYFYDSEADKEMPIAPCNQIRFVPYFDQPNFINVVGVNLADSSSAVSKEVIMGAGETIYASLENLYVVAARYDFPVMQKFDIWMPPAGTEKTTIFRFGLESDGRVTYKGKGSVKGRVLNQFSMDEKGGDFRIATTTGEVWSGAQNPSKNHLFVLDRDNLDTVKGRIEDIAPGEKIYSVRFLGDRAYMVTFKKIDPFFVIDLSESSNPKILGALKIPGYSDYLHPFDDNHIIGFGKEAVDPKEAEQAGFVRSDFAWYQGMKIALFDVTDVANPKVLHKVVIGDRGTDSEVLHNHKALLYDKARNLFAFPVTVAEIPNKTSEYTGSEYGQTVFQGAYVYTLDLENGFTLKGKITNYTDPEAFKKVGYYWFDDALSIKRIVSVGDYLYTVALGKVKAVNRETMEEKKALELQVDQPEWGPHPLDM